MFLSQAGIPKQLNTDMFSIIKMKDTCFTMAMLTDEPALVWPFWKSTENISEGFMVKVHCKKDQNWLAKALEGLKIEGFAIIESVMDAEFIKRSIEGLHKVENIIVPMMGKQRLL